MHLYRSLMCLPRVVWYTKSRLSWWPEECTQNGLRWKKNKLVRNYVTSLCFGLQVVARFYFPSFSESCLHTSLSALREGISDWMEWTDTLVLHLRESNAKFDGCGASAVSCGISLSRTVNNPHTVGLEREYCMYWNNVERILKKLFCMAVKNNSIFHFLWSLKIATSVVQTL